MKFMFYILNYKFELILRKSKKCKLNIDLIML